MVFNFFIMLALSPLEPTYPTPMLIKICVVMIVAIEIITTVGYYSYHKKVGEVLCKIDATQTGRTSRDSQETSVF